MIDWEQNFNALEKMLIFKHFYLNLAMKNNNKCKFWEILLKKNRIQSLYDTGWISGKIIVDVNSSLGNAVKYSQDRIKSTCKFLIKPPKGSESENMFKYRTYGRGENMLMCLLKPWTRS